MKDPVDALLTAASFCSQEPSDLTSQLKSMLNIGGTAPPPFQSRPTPPFQQPGSYQRPSGPVAQPGSYQAPRAQGPFPVMPGSYPGPPPLASVPHYSNLPATAFVPLQVICNLFTNS